MSEQRYTFNWKVKYFTMSCKDTGESIDTPPFTVALLDSSTYTLKLYPKGDADDNWISLKLIRADEDDGPKRLALVVKFTMHREETTGDDTTPVVEKTYDRRQFERSNVIEIKDFAERALFLNSMERDESVPLVLRCEMWKQPSTGPVEGLAVTDMSTRNVIREWVIPDFENFKSDLCLVQVDGDELIWLGLWLDGNGQDLRVWFKVLVPNRPLFLKSVVSVKDVDDDLYEHSTYSKVFKDYNPDWISETPLYPTKNMILGDWYKYLRGGALRLNLDISYSMEEVTTMEVDHQPYPPSLTDVRAKGYLDMVRPQLDLFKALHEKEGCDIKLISNDGKSIDAHKAVLCSKSVVFRNKIFWGQCDLPEEGVSVLEIPELDQEGLREFLTFLYTDRVREMSLEVAERMFDVATAYAVHSMAQLCEFRIRMLNGGGTDAERRVPPLEDLMHLWEGRAKKRRLNGDHVYTENPL